MNTRSVARVTPQIIFGLGIIAVGVILLLHNLGFIHARSYFSYWPVILILIGLTSALQPSGSAGRWFGLVILFLGVLLLLDNLYIIDFYVWDYWPLLLVLAGLALLRSSRRPKGVTHSAGDPSIRISTILGGQQISNKSDDFQGGNASAILGGCSIDLRHADIKSSDVVLDLFTVWGGIEVRVPATWAVQLEGYPILGGFEDKTQPGPGGESKKIIIRGTAIMGGIEIKN
jgi:predicted membrane protein